MYATQKVTEKKPENNSGLNGIEIHDPAISIAMLCQLSYQASWELVKMQVRNVSVEDE